MKIELGDNAIIFNTKFIINNSGVVEHSESVGYVSKKPPLRVRIAAKIFHMIVGHSGKVASLYNCFDYGEKQYMQVEEPRNEI